MKRLTVSGLVIAAILMTGCASPVKEGEQMIRQGQVNEGLAKLEEAVRSEPDNVAYRAALYRNREAVINEKLIRVDALLAKQHYDEAELIYQDVLTMQADNPRALAGLNVITSARRQDSQVVEAQKLMKEGRLEEAQSILTAVLSENPGQLQARELLKNTEKQSPQPGFAPPALAAAYRRPVSLEFRDAPLSQVFNALSMQTQLNFVFDKDVRPDLKTTIFVRSVPLEDAINLILVTNQLDKKTLNESSLLIYPNTPAKQKEYQELEVKSFYLTNADAKITLTMLKTLLKTRDIFVDEKLNLLIMRDTPEVIAMADKLIEAQDKAQPEVMLDVQVLEVSRDRLTNLGILYPATVTASLSSTTTNAAVAAGSTVVQTTQSNPLTLQALRSVNAGEIGISNLSVTANLLKTDSDADLLASPRIRVKNHEKATIHVGDRVPVITTTSSPTVGVAESVTYLDVGLKLEVEPTVYLDDDVGIKVNLEVSNIINTITNASTGTTTYQLGTREAATDLRLKNGETQILAGLINDLDTKTANKVPGLGDLPILGRLFSNHNNEKSKTEIVLLITPHIVRNLERPGANIMQFDSGTESNMGAEPLQVSSVPVRPGIVRILNQPLPAQPETGPQSLQGMGKEPASPPIIDSSGGIPNPPGLAPQRPELAPAQTLEPAPEPQQ